jgi:hypothetical protein
MFERWTDVVAAAAGAMAVAYVFWEIARRQRQLRDLFYILDGDDAGITLDLEHMVQIGAVRPLAPTGAV